MISDAIVSDVQNLLKEEEEEKKQLNSQFSLNG